MMAETVLGILNLSYTDLPDDCVLCSISLLAFDVSWYLQFLRLLWKFIMDSLLPSWKLRFQFFSALLNQWLGFPDCLVVKNPPNNAGDAGLIPGSGRSPGEGKGNSILAWEIPWTVEPGRLQSMGSQRVRHDLETEQQQISDYLPTCIITSNIPVDFFVSELVFSLIFFALFLCSYILFL